MAIMALVVLMVLMVLSCRRTKDDTELPVFFKTMPADWICDGRPLPESDSLYYLDQPAPQFRKEFTAENNVENATFFCNGVNIDANPDLAREIERMGFTIANHGYHHLNGLRTSVRKYITDARKGADTTDSILFRPPYGKIRPLQYMMLRRRYKLIFWDLLLYDFRQDREASRIISNFKRKIRPGSIIVMHDRAETYSPDLLNEVISICRGRGLIFGDLQMSILGRE